MSGSRTYDSRKTDKGALGRPLCPDEKVMPSAPPSYAGTLIENVEERTIVVTPLLAEILHKTSTVTRHGGDLIV